MDRGRLLTLRAVFRLCAELWSWLADHPGAAKHLWPRWAELQQEYQLLFASGCFACAYVNQERYHLAGCTQCPLKECWGSGTCTAPGSPYRIWQDAARPFPPDPPEEDTVREQRFAIRRRAALEIAAFCAGAVLTAAGDEIAAFVAGSDA